MLETLNDDKLINRIGGRFKFTILVQYRIRELMEGSRPLVETNNKEVVSALREIAAGKVTPVYPDPEES